MNFKKEDIEHPGKITNQRCDHYLNSSESSTPV